MGLEEGGGSVAAVKNSPVDCFLARGRVPRRQANLCGKAAGLLENSPYQHSSQCHPALATKSIKKRLQPG